MVATGQSRNAAQMTWCRLKDELQHGVGTQIDVKFPDLRQKTPGAKATQVIEIVMALPGVKARQFRRNAAKVLVRYLGGDVTLLDDVRANAVREVSFIFQFSISKARLSIANGFTNSKTSR